MTSSIFLEANKSASKFGSLMLILPLYNMITLRCKDGYVKVYINGQEEEHQYNKHDYMFCGETAL